MTIYRPLALLICILSACISSYAKDIVRLNHEPKNKQFEYKMAVLNTALSSTQTEYGEYAIEFTSPHITVKRALHAVHSGETLNLFVAITTPEWEDKTIPIRIPVRRGILSGRLLVSARQNMHKFSITSSLDDIKKLSGGVKIGWATSEVLKRAQFNIVEVSSLDSIYVLLNRGKLDYTLRGPNEVFNELSTQKEIHENLMIVPNLMLFIPAPYYMFVSPSEPMLAKRIEVGLEQMVADGSLKSLFYQFYGAELRQANLVNRNLIPVENSELSPLTPLNREALWYFYDSNPIE